MNFAYDVRNHVLLKLAHFPITKRLVFRLTLILLVTLVSCASPEEKSKKQLGRLGYSYNQDSFFKAVEKGDAIAIRLFVKSGMSPDTKDVNGQTALKQAAFYGHLEAAKILIASGADVNMKDSLGYPALMRASAKGRLEIVKALIEARADVNAKSSSGETALKFASQFNHTEIVKALREAGAKE